MQRLFLALIAAVAIGFSTADAPGASPPPWSKLVSPAQMSDLVAAGGVIVLDIRSPKAYAAGHIRGALNAPYGTWRGPRSNPGERLSDDRLTERLQSLGIEPGARVVVTYTGRSATGFGAAARVYWTLKSAGLRQIAILNGGMNSWKAAGLALSTDATRAERSDARFMLSHEWLITREGVRAVLAGDRAAIMVDARPLEFYRGDKKHPMARRAGTLPRALNLVHATWFTDSKTEMSPTALVLGLAMDAGYVPVSGPELVSFCNTGQWAATNWFALSEIAGIEGVKLYPESVVGWSISGGDLVNGP